jgi:hypothetical protein
MCPVCHGSGKPTGDKSVGEIFSGYCYKCHGSGEVTDYIDVPERRSSPTSSSSSSSSSDGSGACIIGIVLAVVIIFVILFAITFAPFVFGILLLISGWKKSSYWLKLGWVVSWFAVPLIFEIDLFTLFSAFLADFSWATSLLAIYPYLGFVTLTVVLVEIVVEALAKREL